MNSKKKRKEWKTFQIINMNSFHHFEIHSHFDIHPLFDKIQQIVNHKMNYN